MSDVKGVAELQRMLKRLDKGVTEKVVAKACRAAMVPMRKQAIAEAPISEETHRTYKGRLVGPGFLKRSIKLKKMRKSKSRYNRVGYTLAARKEAFYGRIVELGFTHNRTGQKIPPNPWLGRAYNKMYRDVDKDFRNKLNKIVKKHLRNTR